MVSAFQYEKWSCLRPLSSEILTFSSNGWGIQQDFQYCLETYTQGWCTLVTLVYAVRTNLVTNNYTTYSTMLSWSKVYLSHKIAVMEIRCLYIKHHCQSTSEHISCEIRKTKKKKNNGPCAPNHFVPATRQQLVRDKWVVLRGMPNDNFCKKK